VAQNPSKHQHDNPTPDRQADRQRNDRGPLAEDRDAEPQGSGRTEGRDVPPDDADRGLESPWMGGG
jgi:hypothetical protein